MTDDKKKIAAVPFDTFERYLGPRYENVIYALQHINDVMNRNQLCIAPS